MTATTSTTTVPLSSLPMNLSSSPERSSTHTTSKESIDSPDAIMSPFTPGQCLLCPNSSPSFNNSVIHMQRSHGLFVPHQRHLVVDLETLFKYLHLVIFGYRECIQCGTARATVQAVQQHMTGKGHCKFDILEQESEFADFYDFSELEYDRDSDIEHDGYEMDRGESSQNPQLTDGDSIRLPSGKIISRKSSAPVELSFTQLHRRNRTFASQLQYTPVEPDDQGEYSKEELSSDIDYTRALSKREKREKAMVTYQMANMSVNDRNGLMHLSISQQRSILATQHRHVEKVQKEERRRQSKIERKGNKNLYTYWATETPIYQCG
jgi:pre-60S factor REI1